MVNRINKLITIVTPTYNRAGRLAKLYQSLVEQKEYNFIWMIIDDGSIDNTYSVASEYIEEDIFPIKYYKKKNGGKHTALNEAIDRTDTELFFIVDSDDYLTSNATTTIQGDWKSHCHKNLCGISYLRGYSEEKPIGDLFPQNGMIDYFAEIRVNRHVRGDKAEVWSTKYLKKFRFPVFQGERFLVESYLWLQVSKLAPMLFINKIIYVTEYLEGGLTQSGRKLRIACPQGGMSFSLLAMAPEYKYKERLKNAILWVAYSRFAKQRIWSILNMPYKWLILSMYPVGLFIYWYWRTKYRDE